MDHCLNCGGKTKPHELGAIEGRQPKGIFKCEACKAVWLEFALPGGAKTIFLNFAQWQRIGRFSDWVESQIAARTVS
jgi:hypothetical protein